MLTTSEVSLLRSACEEYGVKIPEKVPEAENLAAAAKELVAKVATEIEPDPHSVTAKTLEKVHADLVAWPQHDARMTAAAKLLDLANQRVLDTWGWAITALELGFQPVFDKAADAYYKGHTGQSDDPDAVATLADLARIRDVLANVRRAKMEYSGLEQMTRLLHIPNLDVGRRVLPVRLSRDVGGPPVPNAWSADWLRIVCGIDGVRLKWNTVADQEALDREVVKLKDALA